MPEDRDQRASRPSTAGDDPDAPSGTAAGDDEERVAPHESPDLPEDVVEEAERLTRLARAATDPGAAAAYRDRRESLAADHRFVDRVREDDPGETLVLYPEEWVEDGTVRPDRVEDTDRAAEVSLSGPGDPERWERVDEHNRELVAAVRADHGDAHGDNAAALADFAGNHYAKEIESLTGAELTEFCTEYYRRNVWASAQQEAVVEESVRLAFEAAGVQAPPFES